MKHRDSMLIPSRGEEEIGSPALPVQLENKPVAALRVGMKGKTVGGYPFFPTGDEKKEQVDPRGGKNILSIEDFQECTLATDWV